MPQVLPGAQSGVGVLTTLALTAALLVFADEFMDEALKPAMARTRTKARTILFCIVINLLGRWIKNF